MKKIYVFAMFLVIAAVGYSQQNCTNGTPVVRNTTFFANGQQFCLLSIDNMLPNSPVRLAGPNQTEIPPPNGVFPVTDAAGSVDFLYPCNLGIAEVYTCNLNGCCRARVPFASPLPIKLDNVSAKLKNGEVALDWTSVFEAESDKFIVERSTDGRNFTSIGEVKATGSSYRALHYSFADKNIEKGYAYYYRLRLQDLNGSFEYSKVAYVNNKAGAGAVLSIYPNPFVKDIQVVGLTQSQINITNIRIFDMMGRPVRYSFTGANEISIDKNASRGVYILKVLDQTFRIVKQ